jgi:hypothetical protein
MVECFLYCELTIAEMNRIAQDDMPGDYIILGRERGLAVQFKSTYHKMMWEIRNNGAEVNNVNHPC